MKKVCLEMAETTLSVILYASAVLGIFLSGCLFGETVCGGMTTEVMWDTFLLSLTAVYVIRQLLLWVKCRLYAMLIDKMEED